LLALDRLASVFGRVLAPPRAWTETRIFRLAQ
jgi:hypothetical protein